MEEPPTAVWEDDNFVYIPEKLFSHLPPELREAFEACKQRGQNVLRIADKDIQNLIRFANALPTTSNLRYIFHRLRSLPFEASAEYFLELDLLTTAFVVTYSRLFVSGTGGSGVSRDQIPAHLRAVHDDIIDIRHKRYAHNGSHETTGSSVEIDFDDKQFRISLQVNLGYHIGGRDEWEELVAFLDAHMYGRLHKILARLKEKTGYEWVFPAGPPPDWVQSES